MKYNGPLGKYSQVVAAVLATIIIVSSIVIRILEAATGNDIADVFLDNLALIAMGAVFGAAASTAVNGSTIQAAHQRLDQISAPPADYLSNHPEQTELASPNSTDG